MSSTDLTTQDAALEAALAQQDAELVNAPVQIPILKIGQPLTKEVQDEQAEPGDFINTLTGAAYGDKVGFIVSYYNQGRFGSKKGDNRAYVAQGDTIPESWGDLVGPENVGVRFDEYSEAEEQFKAAVNRGDREWEHGPMVSTTHNFTGLVIVPGFEDEPDELQPVRLSLKRTDVKAAKKIVTIKQAILRNKPFWEIVFDLSTVKNKYTQGMSFNLQVGTGRKTTLQEREEAQELFMLAAQGRTVDNSADQPERTAAPKAKGALEL